MEVSSSQCAWVEGEDGEETIPIERMEKRQSLSPNHGLCLGTMTSSPGPPQAPTHFSSRTGARVISVILLQYHTMMIRMLGVRKVFMANHTLVKPPF